MKAYYEATSDLDLNLDEITLPPNEKVADTPKHLRPTAAMTDKFRQNCVKRGILRVAYK